MSVRTRASSPSGGQTIFLRYLQGIFHEPSNSTTLYNNANRVHLHPFVVPVTCTVDAVGIFILSIGTGGNFKLAIYRDNGYTPTGGALLAQTNSFALVGGGYNEEPLTAAVQLTPGLYWAAMIMNTTGQITYGRAQNWVNVGTALAGMMDCGYYDAGAYVFTNPCPVTTGWGYIASFLIRVASVP